jgi:hypothetical protein
MTDTLLTATAEDTTTADTAPAPAGTEETAPAPADVDKPDAATEESADKPKGEGGEDDGQQQDKSGEEEGALTGAPEAYEDFAAPEGVELDADLAGDLKALAKDMDLSQAGAQKVADLGMKLATKWGEEQANRVAEMQAAWKSEAEADKEIGGDALAANLAVAKKALDTYGSPELVALLNESRIGDHPEFLRLMVRFGKTISEDTPVTTGTAAPAARDARGFYPNSNMN